MKWWHRWRAEVWLREALVHEAGTEALRKFAEQATTSYYPDRWTEEHMKAVYARETYKYHLSKS